ncbi:MAG: hypothetical protein RR767_05475 [Acinetobacter sp.]
MEIIAMGALGGDTGPVTNSYTLLDIDLVADNYADALSKMLTKIGGNYISPGPSGSTSDNTVYSNLAVNPWSEVGFTSTASIAMLSDAGLGISPGQFSGVSGPIISNGLFPTNSYMNFLTPVQGALYINMATGADLSGSYTSDEYTTGRLYIFNFGASRGKICVFITIDYEIFFFHDVTAFTPFLGRMAANTRSVLHVASLQKLKVYLVKSKVTTAKGTIKDAAGNPAANCIIYIYKRSSGQLVGKAVSNADGNYESFCMAKVGDKIFMVCLDDDVAPDFEGIVYDRITV